MAGGHQATPTEGQLPVEFLQDLVLGFILYNISISDLKEDTECTLTKSEDTTKPETATDIINKRAATRKHLGKLQEWVTRSLMEFSNGKCQILHLG